MPITITSNLKTSQPYIPLVDDGDQVKIGGVPLLFDSAADLKAKCALQRTNIENGLGLWKNGTPLRVVTEPVARTWIRGTGSSDAANAAASSAKTLTLPFGTVITLLDEANTLTAVTAIPAAGDGANGDQAWNRSTGVIYTKTAGAWAQTGVDGDGNSLGGSRYGAGYDTRITQYPAVPIGTTQINSVASAGATFSHAVDTAATFDGHPTTRVTVTAAGSTNKIEVGISGATYPLDADIQAIVKSVLCAVKIGPGNTLTQASLYLGSADFSSYIAFTMSPALGASAGGWTLLTRQAAGPTELVGTPNFTAPVRCKITLAFSANVQPGTVNIGGVYILPQPRPSVVFMCDDGFAEWTWLATEAKKRGVPLSLGISYGDIGKPSFLTEAEVVALGNDPSGLIEITNHARGNQNFVTLGLAAYMSDVNNCRDWIISRGLNANGARCHAYVQGQYDQTLIDAMRAEGYLCAREVGSSDFRALTELSALQQDANARFRLPATCNLENTQNLATVKTYIKNAAEQGTAVVMGHRFLNVAGTVQWIAGYDDNYGVLNLLDWLAYMRDTKGWRLERASDWARRMAQPGTLGAAPLR